MSSERRTLNGFVSQLVLGKFTVGDVGVYMCRVFVGVLGLVLEKRFDVQLEHRDVKILSSPPLSLTTFHVEDGPTTFIWLLEGNPLDADAQCSAGHVEISKNQNHWPLLLYITLSIPPEIVPNVISCNVTGSNGQILDTRSFRKASCL